MLRYEGQLYAIAPVPHSFVSRPPTVKPWNDLEVSSDVTVQDHFHEVD